MRPHSRIETIAGGVLFVVILGYCGLLVVLGCGNRDHWKQEAAVRLDTIEAWSVSVPPGLAEEVSWRLGCYGSDWECVVFAPSDDSPDVRKLIYRLIDAKGPVQVQELHIWRAEHRRMPEKGE